MFAANRIDLGIYFDLMNPPLAVYIWATGEYEGMAAESFGFDADSNYTVTLKSGVTWSDGSPMSSADIATTFHTNYIVGSVSWNSIDHIEIVDDLTVKFVLSQPSFDIERRILTENLRPASVYGEFGERGAALVESRVAAGDADFDQALSDLTEFRPEAHVSGGPYVLLPENISDASITLVKNEGGLNSDIVQFDEVLAWNGETEQVTPLVQSGELWYATHGFPPATEAAFIEQGVDIIRGPSYNGPALYVNHSVYPLNRVEVRQAIAYVVDRNENGFVSLAESGIAHISMTGLSDNLLGQWLSDDAIASLNLYDYNPDAATALLEGIGFTKDGDVWLDDNGDPLAFELIFPTEFLDWAAAAENAAIQLNDFGFQITTRGVQFQQHQQEVYDSNFQMAIRNWGLGSPFPGESYLQPYDRYNGQGEVAGEGIGGGMQFDPNVTYSGGELNVRDTAIAASQGLDTEAQAVLVTQLALSFNELLPCIPLWERYGNNPLNREFVNAPAGDDPIWTNAGSDHFMPYLIMTGGITPAE
jgi:peptide/nickel transport system substrate-binding protein